MAMHKKPFTVDVDEQLSDAFSAQADERGYTKYRAIEGALRAFIALPAGLQVDLMGNQISDVLTIIKTKLLDADLIDRLESLTPSQRTKLVALAKESAKIISRKK
ncbi:hypothetical protein LCGC14_0400560 [marine sediment metagenome]|uniref:Uncharacterized protein n=1 Tax=marine sediment metagenome TaxID=412755 RepID=A0A0F9VIX8_9ZZZZ